MLCASAIALALMSKQGSHPLVTQRAIEVLDYFALNLTSRPKTSIALFDISEAELASVRRSVGRAVISTELDVREDESTRGLSQRLRAASDKVIDGLATKPSANLESFVRGLIVVDWVRCHIKFDPRLTDRSYFSPKDRADHFAPNFILRLPTPATGCGGITWLCATLAKESGMANIAKVEGRLRGFGGEGTPDHSWIVLNLPSGDTLYAEPTHSRLSLDRGRQRDGDLDHALCFSLDRRAIGLFVADRYAMTRITPGLDARGNAVPGKPVKFDQDPYSKIVFRQWLGLPTTELDPLRKEALRDIGEATLIVR